LFAVVAHNGRFQMEITQHEAAATELAGYARWIHSEPFQRLAEVTT
jgi:hypothetical protein